MDFKQKLEKLGKQPDIILIITDEQTTPGENFPKDWERKNLPTLTRLKENGFSFDKAFCNTCMCSPSRSTLHTSTYPAIHGVTQTLTEGGNMSPGEQVLDVKMPNIMNVLWAQGYDTQYRGKWHMSKGIAPTGANSNYDELTSSDLALYGAMGWEAPDAGEDINPLNFGGGYANHDAKYVAQAIKYLKEVKAQRAAGNHKPFLLILSLVNPHDVLAYPKSADYSGYHSSAWTGREIGLPSTVNEDLLRNKKPMAQAQFLAVGSAGLGPLPTDDDKLNYVNFYGYLMSHVDNEIGKVIDELYKETGGSRLADSTIVFQTSDHGEMGLAHGGLRQKCYVAYEENMKVPLVISNPVLFKDAKLKNSEALATLADIMPTIMELTNTDTTVPNMAGNSLLPTLETGKPVQDSILFTFDDTKAGSNHKLSQVDAANRIRCIRTDEWKYTYYFDDLGTYYNQYELYNLKEDPTEYTNLAYDPAYEDIRNELAAKLHDLEVEKLRKLHKEDKGENLLEKLIHKVTGK